MPQQQQPSQGQITDLLFPVNGVDIAVALEQQLPDTTPVGINVRAFEPQSMRARGGARQGLSKYLNDQLPLSYASGSRVIQNLTLVIDPTGLAVTPSFIDLPSTDFPWELDINLILIDGSYNTVAPGGSGNETAKEYKRKYPQLVIKANDQTKNLGDTFTWTGNEYTISHGSLQPGDSIFTVAFQSMGAPADAAAGTYPIIPSKAVIRQVSTNKPYQVAYQNGTMTVGAIYYLTVFSSTSGSFSTSGTFPLSLSFTVGSVSVNLSVDFEGGIITYNFSGGSGSFNPTSPQSGPGPPLLMGANVYDSSDVFQGFFSATSG